MYYNCYISNEGLFEESDKEDNVEVIGAAATPFLKNDCKTFCPISRIRPVTVRPTSK